MRAGGCGSWTHAPVAVTCSLGDLVVLLLPSFDSTKTRTRSLTHRYARICVLRAYKGGPL